MVIFFKSLVVIGLIFNVCSERVVYSAKYSQIRYQPRGSRQSLRAELNSGDKEREEVTEKPTITYVETSDTKHQDIDDAVSYDVTTEPESEQINLARFIHRNIVKDKLVVQGGVDAATEIVDEESQYSLKNRTAEGDNIKNGNKMTCKDCVNTEKENLTTDDLRSLDESEAIDLNNQGVYFIYHPYMLLQKAVYRTPNYPGKNENIAPIVERIYSYDPRTFVLQRLILRPEEQT